MVSSCEACLHNKHTNTTSLYVHCIYVYIQVASFKPEKGDIDRTVKETAVSSNGYTMYNTTLLL